MKRLFAFDILLILLSCLSACQTEVVNTEPDGRVQLVLQDFDTSVSSRATPQELDNPSVAEFNLEVVSRRDGKTVYEGKFMDKMAMHPGLYDIRAYYGDASVLALDKPCYDGKVKEVEVKSEQDTKVNITCKVSNALCSVVYDNPDDFNQVYSDYYVTVHVGEKAIDIRNAAQSAYFEAGQLVGVVFHGTLMDSGTQVDFVLKQEGELPRVMTAAQHLKITLSANPSAVDMNVTVTKAEVSNVSIQETVPAEWLPKPKLASTDFVNNELSFAETERVSAKLNFKTAAPVQDIKVMLSFEDPDMQIHNGEYLLSNPEDAQKLKDLKINVPSDKSSIDFINLTSQLKTKAGVETTNLVTVDVKANNRWSSEDEVTNRTYILKCTKPEFGVSVYPGNIWTKEFSVNPLQQEDVVQGKGNFVRLSQDMTYQFSTNQQEWSNLDDTMTKKGLTPETKYYVRGMYRGCVPGEVKEVTTCGTPALTNGNLETTGTAGGDDSSVGSRGTIFTFDGWATTNKMTTPDCHAACYSYNSRSGVRPNSSVHSGKNAARLITLSYGYGGTANNPSSFTHSELYLGTDATESGTKTYGIPWNSRPTGLKFWFKCISNKGNDTALAKIEFYSDTELLGSAAFTTAATGNSYSQCELSIDYDLSSSKVKLVPNKLVVVFSSGMKANLNKNDLKKFHNDKWYDDGTFDKSPDPMWRGNEFFIDDVELLYEK